MRKQQGSYSSLISAVCLISTAFALLCGPIIGGVVALSGWYIEVVDGEQGLKARSNSIAVDSRNSLHIAYLDLSQYDLKYATNSSGNWTTYTVDSEGDVGSSSSIALDDADHAHIAYLGSGHLKYALCMGGGWQVSIVDAVEATGPLSPLVLDHFGCAHLSYYDHDENSLKYATNEDGTWYCETIAVTGPDFISTSIDVDSNRNVHVVYCDDMNGSLCYATKVGSTWSSQIIVTYPTWASAFISMAVDGNGRSHMSYIDALEDRLMYATNSGGVWHTEVVEEGLPEARYTSLEISNDGRIHIAYVKGVATDPDALGGGLIGVLKHAVESSGRWTTEVIKEPIGIHPVSITSDGNGLLHISYIANVGEDRLLMHASNSLDIDGSWLDERNHVLIVIAGIAITAAVVGTAVSARRRWKKV